MLHSCFFIRNSFDLQWDIHNECEMNDGIIYKNHLLAIKLVMTDSGRKKLDEKSIKWKLMKNRIFA